MPLEITRGPRMRGKSSFAAGAAKNLGIMVKTSSSAGKGLKISTKFIYNTVLDWD